MLTSLVALVCALFIECPILQVAKFMFKSQSKIPVAKNYTVDSAEETTVNDTEENE